VQDGSVTSLEELAAEVADLRARVAAAEGALALHELKARYAALVDARYEGGGPVGPDRLAELAEAIADLFTPDAVWDGGPALACGPRPCSSPATSSSPPASGWIVTEPKRAGSYFPRARLPMAHLDGSLGTRTTSTSSERMAGGATVA
jgi:hypothetical protein